MSNSPASLSGWGLREGAADAGHPVTHAQFRRYLRAGGLSKPDDNGRWPPTAVARLIRFHELKGEIRSIDARVIRMAGDDFPVDPAALRTAMIAVGRRVKDPRRTLQRVIKHSTSPGARLLRRPPLPPKATWPELIGNASDEAIQSLSPGWLSMAYDVLPAWHSDGANPLADIDSEVIVVMLAIHDLSRRATIPI